MTLRARVTLTVAGLMALAVALLGVAAYLTVDRVLHDQVDTAVRQRATLVAAAPVPAPLTDLPRDVTIRLPRARFGEPEGYVQVVRPDGGVLTVGGVRLPVDGAVRALARERGRPFYGEVTVGDVHLRTYAIARDAGGAVLAALPLTDVDRSLADLRRAFLVIGMAITFLAAALAWFLSRSMLAPVRRLTSAAAHVAETHDLTQRIPVPSGDELGILAESFNRMLGELEGALASQRMLVADASHELRTPLTALRTNVEVLAEPDALPPVERAALARTVRGQIEDLSGTVNDIIDLARGSQPDAEREDVRLDLLVARAVERARSLAPGLDFRTDLRESLVVGIPADLSRAAGNLLDNAAKWSPPGGVVEVAVAAGEVTVRDHGPGIPPEELPLVFDRFHRAPTAVGTPGSGLGLAIVRQVVEHHGGRAVAEAAPGGGALLRLVIPEAPGPAGA